MYGNGMCVQRCSCLSQKSSTTALDRWSSTTRYGDRGTREPGKRERSKARTTPYADRALLSQGPAPLTQVPGQPGWPRAPSSPGAGEPSLAPPVLAGEAGEGIDSSTLVFLGARALQVREEEEVRQLEEQATTAEDRLVEELELMLDVSIRPPWTDLSCGAGRRVVARGPTQDREREGENEEMEEEEEKDEEDLFAPKIFLMSVLADSPFPGGLGDKSLQKTGGMFP